MGHSHFGQAEVFKIEMLFNFDQWLAICFFKCFSFRDLDIYLENIKDAAANGFYIITLIFVIQLLGQSVVT